MSKIKSALELALEKTADLKADPRKLQIKEIETQSRRILGKILAGEEDSLWESYYSGLSEEDKEPARLGALEVILGNFALPHSNEDLKRLGAIQSILSMVFPNYAPELQPMMEQASGIFQQYLEGREEMEKQLMERVEQQLRQKEAMMAQQSGRRVHLNPQDDPELMKMINQQLQSFEEQYKQVVDQMKEQLQQLR